MTEWQSIDSDQFSNSAPRQPARYGPWLYIAGAILILVVAGAVVVYRQRLQRQAGIREDLNAFIFEEESLRYLGQPDRAIELIIPTASPGWRQRYQQTFHTNSGQPPEIQLNEIDFDGECGVVNVSLDGDQGVRSYCLVDRQWRRAPVPGKVWGGEQNEITLTNGTSLKFQSRDEAFAGALADNLPHLFAELDRLLLPGKPSEIVIEPRELEVPLISVDGPRIVLNSPLLVSTDDRVPSSGQARVQTALVKALLYRAGVIPREMPAGLPGAARFLDAAQTVIAINLLLDADTRASLISNWQAQLGGQWSSPFFGDALAAESSNAAQSDLAAYLTAEYIYRTEGLDTLMELLSRLSTVDSWDALFGDAFNQSTLALENQTAARFRLNEGLAVSTFLPDLPAAGTLLAVESQPDGTFRAYTVQPDTSQPLWVEMHSELSFVSANGTSLPAECVPAGASLHIEGKWLETGRRVQANRVTVQDVSLLPLEPAPADTVAYVVEGQPPSDIDLTVNYIFPSNRLFFAPNELVTPQALVAVRKDETLQELTPLGTDLQIVSLPVAANNKPHFMLILSLPGCEQRWFIHYQPEQGITGQWLAPLPPMNWLWQADQESLLFFDSKPGGAGHNIYKAELLAYRPVGKSEMLVSFAGWKVDTGQLVFIRRDWGGAIGIGLLEPVSGNFRRAKIYVYPLHARRLSPDGQWLAFLTGAQNRIDPPYRLELLNLNTLAETTAIQVESDQAIGRAVWSPYLDKPQLAVLSGPLVWEDVLRPNRLLVALPEQNGYFEVVAEVEAGVELLAAPVFCADGSLLYRIDQSDQYQLVHQTPGQAAEVLLTSDQLFKPIACP